MDKKIPHFRGHVLLVSSLSLEEVANILSRTILGGAKFGGKELKIYDKIPTVFTKGKILGLTFVLQEVKNTGKIKEYDLGLTHHLSTIIKDADVDVVEEINLNDYLYALLKKGLKNSSGITVKYHPLIEKVSLNERFNSASEKSPPSV